MESKTAVAAATAPDMGSAPGTTSSVLVKSLAKQESKANPMEDPLSDDDALSDASDNQPYIGHFIDTNHLPSVNSDLTSALASAGPTGLAAAAAISSTRRRKRCYAFETNPSVRKRQQTRIIRKLKQNIEEYSSRVGQQAVVLIAAPGTSGPKNLYAFGAQPLESVVKNLRHSIVEGLETSLANQQPPKPANDPTRHELPPINVDGIPTPVEKMTQAQLRAFIPLMLKYSTGRGKPGWGKDQTRPAWWPKNVPWANVRMDAREEGDKQKMSWTLALREIVTNCYSYHGREDLLPKFNDEELEEEQEQQQSQQPQHQEQRQQQNSQQQPQHQPQQVKQQQANTLKLSSSKKLALKAVVSSNETSGYSPTVLQTIANADGTVSIVQLESSSSSSSSSAPIFQLADGTTAQIQGIAQLEPGQPGVHTLAEVASAVGQHQQQTIEVAGDIDGASQIIITGEDGQSYPVSMSGMITVPGPANMYHAVVANMTGNSSSDTNNTSAGSSSNGNAPLQVLGSNAVVMTSSSSTSQPSKNLTITPVSTSSSTALTQIASRPPPSKVVKIEVADGANVSSRQAGGAGQKLVIATKSSAAAGPQMRTRSATGATSTPPSNNVTANATLGPQTRRGAKGQT